MSGPLPTVSSVDDLGDLPPLLQRLHAAAEVDGPDHRAVETMAAASALACWAEAVSLQATARLRDLRHRAQAELADELGGWDAVADRGGPCDGDEVDRFTAVEVAAALGVSTRTARDRVGLALDVVARQPDLLRAMRVGVVGVAHARAVRDALDPVVDDTVAGALVSGVLAGRLEAARRHGLPMHLGVLGTPAELAGHVRRDATRAGVDAAARCRAARARRRMGSWALPDGMAALQVTGPAVTIAAAFAAVDRRAQDTVDAARAARAARVARAAQAAAGGAGGGAAGRSDADGEDEVPTLDQARADAVLKALTGSPDLERLPGHVGLDVTVLVPLEVLTSVSVQASDRSTPGSPSTSDGGRGSRFPPGPPAELPGLGPLPDVVARAVAKAARRVRVVELDREGFVATPCGDGRVAVASGEATGAAAGGPSTDMRPPVSAPAPAPPATTAPRTTTGSPEDGGPLPGTGRPAAAASCPGDHSGADVYRPGAALERAVRARDMTCRWPGCRARATRCDLDHTVPFPDGPTTGCNLACLCRLHHRAKHRAGWLVLQGASGRLDLISPTGRVHVTGPASWYRRRRTRREVGGERPPD